MSNKKYLIAIDSDGTLRHTDGIISDRTKEIIKKLTYDNNIIVICTARPRYHTLKIGKEVGCNQYLISSNGTEVYDGINDKIIFCSYIPNDICQNIYEDSKKYNVRAIFATDNTEYVTQFTRNDSQILLDDSNKECISKMNIKQVMFIGKDKKIIKNYKKYIIENYDLNIIDVSDNKDKEEIWFCAISKDTSKGIALKKLSSYLNIPIENTIAIGNDENDISMFNVAGISVAVANSSSKVKESADYVTLTNDEDGVADYLETL